MLEAFRLGGFGMFPTFVFGCLLVGLSIRYAYGPERRRLPLIVGSGVVTFLAGSVGSVTGAIKALLALHDVDADKRFYAAIGVGEALHCIALALTMMTLASIIVLVGLWRSGRAAAAPAQLAPQPTR